MKDQEPFVSLLSAQYQRALRKRTFLDSMTPRQPVPPIKWTRRVRLRLRGWINGAYWRIGDWLGVPRAMEDDD